jgi:hypothetical protein
MDLERAHQVARERGVNPIVYWIVRAILQPFFHLYFRIGRVGIIRIPAVVCQVAGDHAVISSSKVQFAALCVANCNLGAERGESRRGDSNP